MNRPTFTQTSHRRRPGIPAATVLALGLLWWAAAAQALPRYAASYGQSCNLCHENPTGGGLRNLYATQYLIPVELAANGWPTADEAGFLADHSPQISPNLSVGADLRTLVYQGEQGSGGTFAMQGDLYVNLRLTGTASAYLEQGLNSRGEVFGLLQDLPLEGHLKAGRFLPDVGWRFADHQMFNRRYLLDDAGSDNPAFLYGSGLEIGAAPGPFEFSAALLDGQAAHGDNYAVRSLVRHELGELRLGVGASLLRRSDPDGHRRVASGFWYLGAGPVTWLGEVDETRRPTDSGAARLGNLAAHEVAITVARGWDARLTYNFQDPNRAEKSGDRHRYGAGVAYMPRPFFALLLMGNYWDPSAGADIADPRRWQGELMVHFFY